MTNLTNLVIQRNELTELPETIGNLTNLITLDLSQNKLTKLPQSIGNLKNILDLRLNNNNLRSLPESFGNLENINLCQGTRINKDFLSNQIVKTTSAVVLMAPRTRDSSIRKNKKLLDVITL